MNRYLVEVMREALDAERRRQELLALVLQDFVYEPGAMVRRGVLHEAVARRLNRSVSNGLVADIKDAIFSLPGVHGFIRNGCPFYRGLKVKDPEPSTGSPT